MKTLTDCYAGKKSDTVKTFNSNLVFIYHVDFVCHVEKHYKINVHVDICTYLVFLVCIQTLFASLYITTR